MRYDRPLTLSVAGNRRSLRWPAQSILWSGLADRLKIPVRGEETLVDYLRMPKAQQDDLKDVGGFVGGALRDGLRRNGAVQSRDIVTLDLDNIPALDTQEVLKAVSGLGCAYAVYSTRKHEPARPRLRVLIPLSRSVSADEYEPIARRLGAFLGMERMDPTTFQAVRMMYWPSCCADAEYVFRCEDRPFANADGLLRMYADWRDISSWPQVPGLPKLEARMLGKQEDPLVKTGVIGAFCRTYSIEEAMEHFLPGVYAPCGDNRYTFAEGSTTGGAIVYDGKYLFSHHATDPCSEKLCNAFDLVRLHKFTAMDDDAQPGTPIGRLPSYAAMTQLATGDEPVRGLLLRERVERARTDFAQPMSSAEAQETLPDADPDWQRKLSISSKGAIQPTSANTEIILANDPALRGLWAYDRFAVRVMVMRATPWASTVESVGRRPWTDGDAAGMRCYLAQSYGIVGKPMIDDVFVKLGNQRAYDDVGGYIAGLQWDGVPRIERLWVRYLGAEDSEYTRAVTRKSLVACVARALNPGVKFDYVLTLVGGQGLGKTHLLELLGRSWFNSSLTSFNDNKAASELIQGSWLVELGELSALRHSELTIAKQFITRTTDRFRAAYGHYTDDYPRRCVFFATTNKDDFLRDETGERRFWPVSVRRKLPPEEFEDFAALVDQFWAEAKAYYQLGERLYLDDAKLEAEARAMQARYREDDGLEGMIRAFLERKVPADWYQRSVRERRAWLQNDFGQVDTATECVQRVKICAREVWAECMGKDLAYCDNRQIREINNALVRLEWVGARLKFGGEYGQQRGYRAPGSEPEDGDKAGSTAVTVF